MIKSTFFDALLIADSERIHTQTLYWVLSLQENIFSSAEKARFLNNLFDLREKIKVTNNMVVATEINKIDLLIRTDNYVIILENKLKSSEHSYQTQKYLDAIPEEYSEGAEKICGFVSLINETPLHKAWYSISFEKLLQSLKNINWNSSEAKELIFVNEYILTLENLVFAFNTFIKDHKAFANVFIDGYKSKFRKVKHENSVNDYIRINQLETIFQKAYLMKVVLDLNEQYCYVGETRGTALIQINVHHFEYRKKKFNLGFQFQNSTLKINLSKEGVATSKASQLDYDLISNFESKFFRANGYNRFNKPKTKAYMSVSKQLGREIYLYDTDELSNLIKDELNYLKSEATEFCKILNYESAENALTA